jgi:hypothetical protein
MVPLAHILTSLTATITLHKANLNGSLQQQMPIASVAFVRSTYICYIISLSGHFFMGVSGFCCVVFDPVQAVLNAANKIRLFFKFDQSFFHF